MTFAELRQRMLDFGFEEQDYLSDPMTTSEFIESINHARQTISQYFPQEGRYDFVQDGTATGLHKIDLQEKTENDVEGNIVPISFNGTFDSFDSMQVIQNGRVQSFGDYTIEQGHIIVLNYALEGSFTIFFERGVTLFTISTQDNADIEIHPEAEHLVPLLASYHAWLDDDMQKAVLYYNEYEQERNNLQALWKDRAAKGKARIIGGLRWH